MTNAFLSKLQQGLLHRGSSSQVSGEESGELFLLVGLGNPGREYRETRHNVGFLVIDKLAKDFSISLTRVQHKALVNTKTIGDSKIVLAKPQTFMNASGESVAGLVHFYKLQLNHVLVIHDDLDLPFGTLRMRGSGSSAGQKGMQSILTRLGSEEIARLRVGIGRPAGSKQGANYVLKGFSPQERKELDYIIDRAASAALTFVQFGLETAMNKYNGSQIED